MADRAILTLTEDEERFQAQRSTGGLMVPRPTSAHSDVSEEDDEDEEERKKRASGRKSVRLLELQDVKPVDFDALVARCEEGTVKNR